MADEVRTVVSVKARPFVVEWQGGLPHVWYAPNPELDRQRLLVDGLQEAAPQMPVNLHGRSNDRVCSQIPRVCSRALITQGTNLRNLRNLRFHPGHLRFHSPHDLSINLAQNNVDAADDRDQVCD